MKDFPAAGARELHLRWLLEITGLPTASGQEWRVVDWIRAWVRARGDLRLIEDRAGNLVVEPKKRWGKRGARPVYITAHLDHPAFVVERVIGPGTVELSFRGGVMDAYFQDGRVVVHPGAAATGSNGAQARGATLMGEGAGIAGNDGTRLFKTYIAELDGEDDAALESVSLGDVATWELPPPEVDGEGIVHTHACDDLAALAAAISAYDTLRGLRAQKRPTEDVRLIFTRSEEIGFTGAIAACKLKTMAKGSRVIALENSRSFADSPIGGGPIVRVGDRMSIFDPRLTAACAKRAEEISGNASGPHATQRESDLKGWRWQRKLMAGGACEATVFCAYGYQATCLCLPLGNYHNMADLAAVQDGTHDTKRLGPPRVGREFIHRDDYFGLVDLLVAIGESLPDADPAMERIEKLYEKTKGVLGEGGLGEKSLSRGQRASRSKSAAGKSRWDSRKRATRGGGGGGGDGGGKAARPRR